MSMIPNGAKERALLSAGGAFFAHLQGGPGQSDPPADRARGRQDAGIRARARATRVRSAHAIAVVGRDNRIRPRLATPNIRAFGAPQAPRRVRSRENAFASRAHGIALEEGENVRSDRALGDIPAIADAARQSRLHRRDARKALLRTKNLAPFNRSGTDALRGELLARDWLHRTPLHALLHGPRAVLVQIE